MTRRRVGLECCACGHFFTSDSAFRKHRVGSYGDPIYDAKGKVVVGYAKSERRCLTEVDMQSKGMGKTNDGLWTTGEFNAEAFSKKERMKV